VRSALKPSTLQEQRQDEQQAELAQWDDQAAMFPTPKLRMPNRRRSTRTPCPVGIGRLDPTKAIRLTIPMRRRGNRRRSTPTASGRRRAEKAPSRSTTVVTPSMSANTQRGKSDDDEEVSRQSSRGHGRVRRSPDEEEDPMTITAPIGKLTRSPTPLASVGQPAADQRADGAKPPMSSPRWRRPRASLPTNSRSPSESVAGRIIPRRFLEEPPTDEHRALAGGGTGWRR